MFAPRVTVKVVSPGSQVPILRSMKKDTIVCWGNTCKNSIRIWLSEILFPMFSPGKWLLISLWTFLIFKRIEKFVLRRCEIISRTETGKLHSVIYDVTGSYAYVAFARPTGHATSAAYLQVIFQNFQFFKKFELQAYTRLDLEGLFTLRPRDNIKK